MITIERFIEIADRSFGLDLRNPANEAQLDSITHQRQSVLQIVAGPGSGKTTVLVLRALRMVLVDDIMPEQILITTFTRKAARELRSRWLSWGGILLKALSSEYDLNDIDLNRCQIDTLDSTIHSILTDHREAGTLAPAVSDITADILRFKRGAFRSLYSAHRMEIEELVEPYLRSNPGQYITRGQVLHFVHSLFDRLTQDRVDLDRYHEAGPGQAVVVQMLRQFYTDCGEANTLNFAQLAARFLAKLIDLELEEWVQDLECILVDEYQDTNPLQEEIYFRLMRLESMSATIVGDDDQAMYRFRGGSVELFTDFATRLKACTGRRCDRINMVRNFRSLPEIVDFVNSHVSHDTDYQSGRIRPRKPPIEGTHTSEGPCVLGLFRPNQEVLARDLAELLSSMKKDRMMLIPEAGVEINLTEDNDFGDYVFLSFSVKESNYNRYAQDDESRFKTRFPGLLRTELADRGISVFNPRGHPLRTIVDVQRLLGVLLIAIDPESALVDEMDARHEFTREARTFLDEWRNSGERFIEDNPMPNDEGGLARYVGGWAQASSGRIVPGFPGEFPVLEAIFTVITWLPGYHTEPEHQVWLEALTRVIAGASAVSPYRMLLRQNTQGRPQGRHVNDSRRSLIRDVLAPIAANEIDVDEDIMSSVPRDYLQFMTIHQAKGLEFPLVIVDVGSAFGRNSPQQRFLRFPDEISDVVRLENDIEAYLGESVTPNMNGLLRTTRDGMDRTFDDLVRLYYVAFSRAQSVLLLIGNEKQLHFDTTIRNVALGWARNETWSWRQAVEGRRRPVRVQAPFVGL